MLTVTATLEQLNIAYFNDLRLYATPSRTGVIMHTYWASRPSWQDDFVAATVQDFLEAEGYTDLWDEESDQGIIFTLQIE